MLSRVISLRDVTGVDAQPFAPAPLSSACAAAGWAAVSSAESIAPPGFDALAAESSRLKAENQSLAVALANSEAQLAAIEKEAYDAGRRQGEQDARLELTPLAEKMNQSIINTIATRDEARHRAERDVVNLALLIAKRILHREIATDPGALAALARVVFERMARAESYTLTIHPQFLAGIQSALSGAQSAKVKIDADSGCVPGTFLIRSAEGSIDASIDTQLEEISRGLADRLADK